MLVKARKKNIRMKVRMILLEEEKEEEEEEIISRKRRSISTYLLLQRIIKEAMERINPRKKLKISKKIPLL